MLETLDLDRIGPEAIARILMKIARRGCVLRSAGISGGLDGYHVTLNCYCGACRLVWDDVNRLSKDMRRPPHMRNVMFNIGRARKVYLTRGGSNDTSERSERERPARPERVTAS